MLILKRTVGQRIIIGHDVIVTVVDVGGNPPYARLGVEAPLHIQVDREEIRERKDAAQQKLFPLDVCTKGE